MSSLSLDSFICLQLLICKFSLNQMDFVFIFSFSHFAVPHFKSFEAAST